MRSNMVKLSTIVLTLGLGNLVHAAGDPEAGAKKTARCMGCHGKVGHAPSPMYPSLAGQDSAYLEEAMKAYRDGTRTGRRARVMVSLSRNLSDQDIADIAAFYSQQQ